MGNVPNKNIMLYLLGTLYGNKGSITEPPLIHSSEPTFPNLITWRKFSCCLVNFFKGEVPQCKLSTFGARRCIGIRKLPFWWTLGLGVTPRWYIRWNCKITIINLSSRKSHENAEWEEYAKTNDYPTFIIWIQVCVKGWPFREHNEISVYLQMVKKQKTKVWVGKEKIIWIKLKKQKFNYTHMMISI